MFPLIAVIAVLAGIVPMLCYLAFIYWLDRYEREPWWIVALVFLWGGLGGAGFGCCINSTLVGIVQEVGGTEAATWVGPVMIAPMVEEVTKIVPLFVLLFMRHFDNQTDGLIYGAACGLGFAMTENVSYFIDVGSSAGFGPMFVNILLRTCFTALVHCAASATWGFFLGLVRYRAAWVRWLVVPPVGYLAAVSIHAFWNFSATYSATTKDATLQLGACAAVIALAFVMFGLTQASLYLEHQMIKRELQCEVQLGTLPAEHAAIVPYWLKRTKRGWLAPHIEQDRYVEIATLLAFRRHQYEVSSDDQTKRELYEEIERYRAEIRTLLQPPGGSQGYFEQPRSSRYEWSG